jgi:hypothetical protein
VKAAASSSAVPDNSAVFVRLSLNEIGNRSRYAAAIIIAKTDAAIGKWIASWPWQGQGGLMAFIQEACELKAALQLETWIKPVSRLIGTWLSYGQD